MALLERNFGELVLLICIGIGTNHSSRMYIACIVLSIASIDPVIDLDAPEILNFARRLPGPSQLWRNSSGCDASKTAATCCRSVSRCEDNVAHGLLAVSLSAGKDGSTPTSWDM